MKIENTNNLPQVLTVYSAHQINYYRAKGHEAYVVPIRKSSMFMHRNLLLENRVTGDLIETTGRTVHTLQYGGRTDHYPRKEWKLIKRSTAYLRERRHPNRGWGAYVLPINVQEGDRVYISDLIEDVIATDFWGPIPADDGEGIWDGKKICLDMKPYSKIHLVG